MIAPRITKLRDQALVSRPLRSSHFATNGGDKQATENQERVSRLRPHFNAADLTIGTPERDEIACAQRPSQNDSTTTDGKQRALTNGCRRTL